MVEYIYRDFKITFTIQQEKSNLNVFKADGYALCLKNKKDNNPKIHFTTEFPTAYGAEENIKSIIKDYIDFEWDQFQKINEELTELKCEQTPIQ